MTIYFISDLSDMAQTLTRLRAIKFLIEIISNLETITNAEYCELYSIALTKIQEV